MADLPDIRILLIESDDMLLAEAGGLGHRQIAMEIVPSALAIEPIALVGRCDVLVIGIDMPSGAELLQKVGRMVIGPPVIALAARGAAGQSLEHTLTLAELRGAALALPKPIDAEELVLAAIRLLGQSRPLAPELDALAAWLDRRLAL